MLTPSESAALDAWITRCPDDEPCGECSGCGHESTELDADDRCPSCTLVDDSALDAILADAPEADREAREAGTLCEECGRPMADARGPLCSCCAANWFTPGVTVPRADHEGPRPVIFDCAAMYLSLDTTGRCPACPPADALPYAPVSADRAVRL